ncbi:MAG: amidohydrolase family protein [Gemmatimonadetes bacterium]|nr:amidohydrolase family protein [Gemmatimonadota bacterium]
MRRLVGAGLCLAGLPALGGAQAAAPEQVRLSGVLPPGVRVTQFALTADARRVYYGDSTRAIWLYDRSDKSSVRLAGGENSDLVVAPSGNALAYVKRDASSADQHIWILPLDGRTGVASGAERRASARQGDAPAFSPDGRWIAFAHDDAGGVGQSVVVVAVGGGGERTVVPLQRSSMSAIRWAPDGRSIYYSVNGPPPCDPEWSCLELKPAFKQTAGSLRRVALNGGESAVVVPKLGNGWPGLSNDGTLLVYGDTSSARLVVADGSGKRLSNLPMPARQTIEGWLGPSTLVFSDRGDSRRLRAHSLSDGSSRVLIDSLESLVEISPSPDGQLVSAVRCVGQACEVRVVGAGGAPVNTIKLPERYGGGNVWSPDSRSIAFMCGSPAAGANVYAADVASGAVTRLLSIRALAVSLLWDADARSVLVSATRGTGAARRAMIQRVTLDGQARTLRELVLGPTPIAAQVIDGSHALVIRGSSVTLATLDGDSTENVVLPPSNDRYAGYVAVSPDGQRLAFRRSNEQNEGQVKAIEVVNRDGGGRVTIDLPFVVYPGASGLRFLGKDQLAVLAGAGDDEPVPAIYVVNVATKAIQTLVRFPQLFVGEMNVSPDGGTVYYVSNEFTGQRVFTMDLSPLRAGGRP